MKKNTNDYDPKIPTASNKLSPSFVQFQAFSMIWGNNTNVLEIKSKDWLEMIVSRLSIAMIVNMYKAMTIHERMILRSS